MTEVTANGGHGAVPLSRVPAPRPCRPRSPAGPAAARAAAG